MKQSQRVTSLLAKYASIIGGTDVNGTAHPQDPEKQKQHLFVIRNKDMDEPHWAFVPGNVIASIIIDDCYEVDHIGLQRDYLPPDVDPVSPAQKEVRKKILKYTRKQDQDIQYGLRMNRERQGIFEAETEPESEELTTKG